VGVTTKKRGKLEKFRPCSGWFVGHFLFGGWIVRNLLFAQAKRSRGKIQEQHGGPKREKSYGPVVGDLAWRPKYAEIVLRCVMITTMEPKCQLLHNV